jgi:hypothetical protein
LHHGIASFYNRLTDMNNNHKNRGWRARWSVDLETATATHIDGWVFKFHPAKNEPDGVFDGRCLEWPIPLEDEHKRQAARIAREAGEIYIEARKARN